MQILKFILRRSVGIGTAITVLLVAGCATKQPQQQQPTILQQEEIMPFLRRARAPREFGLRTEARNDEPAFRGANRLEHDQVESLAFQSPRQSSIPVVTVTTARGKTHKMIVDTTSRKSWIDWSLVDAFGVVPLGPPGHEFVPEHVYTEIPGILGLAPELAFRRIKMRNALIYARAAHGNFHPLCRGCPLVNIRMVMGCGMLQAFDFVQIDYPKRMVTFSTTTAYLPDPDYILVSLPIVWTNGVLNVWGNIDGRRRTIMIDTSGDYSLVLPDATENTIIRHLALDEFILRQVPATSTAAAGVIDYGYPRIGTGLLKDFVIVIDNARGLLHIKLPEATDH